MQIQLALVSLGLLVPVKGPKTWDCHSFICSLVHSFGLTVLPGTVLGEGGG